MKIILASVLGMSLCVAPISANAEQTSGECSVIGSLAQNIMEGRQSGREMSSMISATVSVPDNPYADLGILLIIEAFRRPQFFTDIEKDRAVTEFRNEAELVC